MLFPDPFSRRNLKSRRDPAMAATSSVPERTSRSDRRHADRGQPKLATRHECTDPVRSPELVRGEAQHVESARGEVDVDVTDSLDRIAVRGCRTHRRSRRPGLRAAACRPHCSPHP